MWYPIKFEIFKRPYGSSCTWKTYWNITHRMWGSDIQRLTLIFLGVFGIEIMWKQTMKGYMKKKYGRKY